MRLDMADEDRRGEPRRARRGSLTPMSAAPHRTEDGEPAHWLLRSGDVLAALGAAPPGRVVRAPLEAPVVLRRAALVRAVGAGRGADVAWCRPPALDAGRAAQGVSGVGGPDGDEVEVHRMRTLSPGRPMLVRPGGGVVVLADAGAFDRWSLQVGDHLALRGR